MYGALSRRSFSERDAHEHRARPCSSQLDATSCRWTTFTRIVDRYGGDQIGSSDRVLLTCRSNYRIRWLLRSSLTYREEFHLPATFVDLRRSVAARKRELYHMVLKPASCRRSTPWRMRNAEGATGVILTALAQRLVPRRGRSVRRQMNCRLDLTNPSTPNGRDDHRSVALSRLSEEGAGLVQHIKAGKVEVCTRCSTCDGNGFRVLEHLGWQAARRAACPPICWIKLGSRSHLRRGSCAYADFARLYVLHQAGAFFVTPPSQHRCSSRLFGADGIARSNRQFICRRTDHPRLGDELLGQRRHGLPRTSAAHPLGIGPASSPAGPAGRNHHVTDFSLRAATDLQRSQKPLAGGTLPGRSSWIEAASSDQVVATARQETR